MTAVATRRQPYRQKYPKTDLRAVLAVVLVIAGFVALLSVVLVPYSGPHYLYHGNEDTNPVIDYVKHEENGEYGDKSSNSSTSTPVFLNSTEMGPHVVEFYAPWCPHCQHFKPKYVKLAREVQATEAGKEVEFYAVSCTAHGDICKQEKIRSFPTIKFYIAGNSTGKVGRNGKLSAGDVLEILILGPIISKENKLDLSGKDHAINTKRIILNDAMPIGHVPSFPEHRQADILSDAALSFDFALMNSIFTSMNPLSSDESKAFRNWIKLVQHATPPQMRSVHEQSEAILKSFDSISRDHAALKEIIRDKKPISDVWSASCARGSKYAGYTCGLWELFHIITVGVAEWNSVRSQEGHDSELISSTHAASVLRDYIEHFFGCEVCRENFIQMYDACAFDRCARLSEDSSATSWKYLCIWLFETHNDINVRLLREKAEREGNREPNDALIWAVRWPSKLDCANCWNVDGTFDSEAVYRHLKKEYWPVSNEKGEKRHQEMQLGMASYGDSIHWNVVPLHSAAVIAAAIICSCLPYVWWVVKWHGKERSGRHKKSDSAGRAFLPL
uniref:Sulfhydryl oxidase n=1 Tax=Odontella aurita TaxID=265563 RepID=A0A7S4JEJ4_9STRA|mmetsp:Transcript_44960/g.137318  ORF Transcript_44960/g.137318 Transcript_44960/m.137318 type:complete len:559 (+) Transcript_44960:52-1728(+)